MAPWERHQISRLLNELSSPNVTIRSAARASAAVPGLVDAVQLEAKDASGQVRPYLPGRRWVTPVSRNLSDAVLGSLRSPGGTSAMAAEA